VYRLSDEAAALHLCRVAAGLDSLVPGEGEILGQVRDAFETGLPGPILDRLFSQALHAGKKVRAETAIGENPASVSSAAAALAQQVFGELEGCRVLLAGAGHIAELAARALVARGASVVYVANRSEERGRALAERFGGAAVPLDQAAEHLRDVDVLVSATGASDRTLGRTEVEAALRSRKGRPLFLIDLAVPRDLDPAIHELDNCFLYDIDDLESVVAAGLAGRRREAVRAEGIVAAEAERFREWHASRDVVPEIASLRAWAEEVRAAELARSRTRMGLSESQEAEVDSVTARIVDKLLHLPTVRLKEAAAGANGGSYAEALRHLFGLDDSRR
jgi:glutamyl-tRNA reductase